MSFQDAETHATKALSAIKSGNASKAMHHIGHAMSHLRSKTSGAGRGVGKLPSDNSAPVMDMRQGGSPTMTTDAKNPITNDPNKKPSAAGSLRARLTAAKMPSDHDADDMMSAGGAGY